MMRRLIVTVMVAFSMTHAGRASAGVTCQDAADWTVSGDAGLEGLSVGHSWGAVEYIAGLVCFVGLPACGCLNTLGPQRAGDLGFEYGRELGACLARNPNENALGALTRAANTLCHFSDPTPPPPPPPPPPSGGTSSMTWELGDGCNDGRGLQARFFDVDNNLVWPDSSQVWVGGSGETIRVTLACRTGAKICYGARTNPDDLSGYWGVDIDGAAGCDACCYACADGTFNLNLTCS